MNTGSSYANTSTTSRSINALGAQSDSNSFKQTAWDLFLISSAVVLGLSAGGAVIVFAILLFLCKF